MTDQELLEVLLDELYWDIRSRCWRFSVVPEDSRLGKELYKRVTQL